MPYNPPGPQSPDGLIADAQDRLNPELNRANAAMAGLPADVREAFGSALRADDRRTADDRMRIGEAMLQVAALPEESSADRQDLRQELQLAFQPAGSDPEKVLRTALKIAGSPDRDLCATLLSRYGRTYLEGRGLSNQREFSRVLDGVRMAAIEGAKSHGTPAQKAAAQALTDVAAPLRRQLALKHAQKTLTS